MFFVRKGPAYLPAVHLYLYTNIHFQALVLILRTFKQTFSETLNGSKLIHLKAMYTNIRKPLKI